MHDILGSFIPQHFWKTAERKPFRESLFGNPEIYVKDVPRYIFNHQATSFFEIWAAPSISVLSGPSGQLQAVSVPQDPWLFALDECFWETFQVDQAEFERC